MKNKSMALLWLLLALLIFIPIKLSAQIELVPVDNDVYPFLEKLSLEGLIDFNQSNIPISRRAVASYLEEIEAEKGKLSRTEQNILSDLFLEFSFDINKNLHDSYSFTGEFKPANALKIFSDKKQKYLASYADSNFSIFLDGVGAVSYRDFDAQGSPRAAASLFEIGPRLSGTINNSIGFYVQVTEGQTLTGEQHARSVIGGTDPLVNDPLLVASQKFVSAKYITAFNAGYLRYESGNGNVALMLGRDNFELGNGYIDKLWVSDFAPPFDFARVDLRYKFFRYTFFYGDLQGDSLGTPQMTNNVVKSKNIVGNYLSIETSPSFRFGIYQSLILANTPFLLSFFNPISVLESASLNTYTSVDAKAMIGFDSELRPCPDLGIQASFFFNDLNFSTIGKKGSPAGNDNKFGYQLGLMYADPFGISNLTAKVEYTLLDPFVYNSRTNMTNYTNWDESIGTPLPPNSDQIALELNYYLTNRITINFLYRHQRSGTGFLDANGNPTLVDTGVITRNFGGDINRGDLDGKYVNNFLMGLRVNRNIFVLTSRIEPIRQYYIDLGYSYESIDDLYSSRVVSEQFFYATISTDF